MNSCVGLLILMIALSGSVFAQEKSKFKAALYSAAVPGAGELYLNDWKVSGWGAGAYFFAAETGLWTTHLSTASYSSWVKSDARALAGRSAGVDLNSPKPSKFYVNIGKYSDIYAYNDEQRRITGTALLYEENTANYWLWDTESHRERYDRLRVRSDRFDRISKYMYFGMFVNRVLSVVYTVRQYKKRYATPPVQINWLPPVGEKRWDVMLQFRID